MRAPRPCILVASERADLLLELLTAGLPLAEEASLPLVAVALGSEGDGAARRALDHGADEALSLELSPSELARARCCVEALMATLGEYEPTVMLLGATVLGTEVGARLAQQLGAACCTEALELKHSPEGPVVLRRCKGRFLQRELLLTRPALVTVAPHRFVPAPRRPCSSGQVRCLRPACSPSPVRRRELRPRALADVDLEGADIVVSAGRGFRKREDLHLIEELAEALGGLVGASRPIAEHLQWLPLERKVGLSGRTVRPELYVAVGISGQIEHLVGMGESRVVVAINNDPAAPIHAEADYSVLGDLYEVLPALTAAIRRTLTVVN